MNGHDRKRRVRTVLDGLIVGNIIGNPRRLTTMTLRRRWGHAQRERWLRTRRRHTGVSLVRPRPGHTAWCARFTDPDTGKSTEPTLAQFGVTDVRAAIAWAERKSHELASRRDALYGG